MKKVYLILVVCLIAMSGNAYAGLFQRVKIEPIEGKVVDMETLKPLENVNVVAVWYKPVGFEGSREIFYAEETVTNKDGFFEIDKSKDKFLLKEPHLIRTPTIVFFNSGYLWESIYDYKGKRPRMRSKKYTIEEIYKTGIIKLEKFEGDLIAWSNELSMVKINIVAGKKIEDYDLKIFFAVWSKEEEMTEKEIIKQKRGITKSEQRRVY